MEWDRDGQYFHYLTKWMHVLHRVARETGENRYHRWAIELAMTAHDAFTYKASAEPAHRQSSTWTDHRDINTVMLATSIAPQGYLQLS